MGDSKAITYKEVDNTETWRKIGEITGSGTPALDVDGNASIDLTNVSDAKQGQIDRLLAKEELAKEEPASVSKSAKSEIQTKEPLTSGTQKVEPANAAVSTNKEGK